MADEVEYELRVGNDEYAQRIGLQGGLLFMVTLPEGTPIEWDPPVAGAQMPEGLPLVELRADGVLVAAGKWPNLTPVSS